MKTETAKLESDSITEQPAGWAGMKAANEHKDHSAAEPQPNTKKLRSPQKGAKGAKRSTGQHSLRIFVPSAPFRGQEFLASREGFSGSADARPSWPQQPRTLATLRVKSHALAESNPLRPGWPRADALGRKYFHFPARDRSPFAIHRV